MDGLQLYYTAASSASKKGVVVFYDVHGFSGGRIKGVCDAIASQGFHVVMPDVYKGTNIKAEGGFGSEPGMAWLKKVSVDADSQAAPAFAKLKSVGCETIGAVGFCWGAYPVCKLAAASKITAAVCAHPSLKIGNMFFEETVEAQCANVKAHLLFMPASNDDDYYRDGTLTDLIKKNGFEATTEDFPDMKHGWVPRGDTGDDVVKRDVERAINTATAFFEKHL